MWKNLKAIQSVVFKSGTPACAWFLKIDPVRIVSMCVSVFACVSAPKSIITSGMMSHNIDPIRLVKQVL